MMKRFKAHSKRLSPTWYRFCKRFSVVCFGVILVSCSNSSVSVLETTTTKVAVTQPRDGKRITQEWFQEIKDYLGMPSLNSLSREVAIGKLSGYQAGLVDTLAVTRSNSDLIISTVAAEWLSQIATAVDAILEAIRTNDKEGLAIAFGKYDYLRSAKKIELVIGCLTDEENC